MTTPNDQPPPFANVSQFSPQQLQEMETARKAMKPIRRAVFMANTDGWSLAVFAGLSLICGFSSLSNILVGAGLGIVAWVELRNIPRLKQLDPEAPRILCYNQLALAGVLILYAAYNLLFPTPISAELQSPEIQQAMGGLANLEGTINNLVYIILIAVAIFAQGSLALFYFRREKSIRDYLANTPAWIIQMQKAGFSL